MKPEEIKEAFRHLEANQRFLSLYTIELVNGLKRHYKRWGGLSSRQAESLQNIILNLTLKD